MIDNQEKRKAFFGRLRFYVFGVALGCLLVYVLLFRGRSCTNWTPDNQILGKIRSNELLFTSNAECMMQCLNISRGEVKRIIDSLGVVNMDQSNVHITECPIYAIEDKEKYEVQLL